ncbi:MAG: hypothetical protein ACRDSE_21765, partial [Pseudonocardiaceae bacterium]
MTHGLRTEPDLVGALAKTMQTSGTQGLVMCGEGDDTWPASAQRDMADAWTATSRWPEPSPHHAVLQVSHAWRLDHPHLLQVDLRRQVVQQARAAA